MSVGYIRLIALEPLKETIRQVLGVIIENGWSLDNLSISECRQNLPECDNLLIQNAFSRLGKCISGSDDRWCLDELTVARYSADSLFRNYVKTGSSKKVKICISMP